MTASTFGSALVVLAALLGSSPAWAQQSPASVEAAKKPVRATLQGFSVVLVLGDLQSGPTADNVPVAARKALDDMKDFLPYKSYRLLDTAWVLGSNTMRATTTRLGGSGDEQYEVSLDASGDWPMKLIRSGQREMIKALGPSPSVHVRFVLRQPRGVAESVAPPERVNQGLAAADGWQAAAGAATVIDTAFSMDIGETVVVGTSRVRGDKALIALLTAVPRK